MKKIALLLLISSFAFAQNVTKKQDIDKLLLKTWKADYGMMDGLKIEKMGKMKQLEYTFKADKTYTLNKDKSGQWKYNEKKKCIDLYQDGKLRSTITTLKQKNFVMILTPDKSTPKGIKTFEIFFKPKA